MAEFLSRLDAASLSPYERDRGLLADRRSIRARERYAEKRRRAPWRDSELASLLGADEPLLAAVRGAIPYLADEGPLTDAELQALFALEDRSAVRDALCAFYRRQAYAKARERHAAWCAGRAEERVKRERLRMLLGS